MIAPRLLSAINPREGSRSYSFDTWVRQCMDVDEAHRQQDMINPRPANKKGQTGGSSNTATTGSSTSNTKNTTQASTSTAQAQSSNKPAGNKKPKGNGIRKLT